MAIKFLLKPLSPQSTSAVASHPQGRLKKAAQDFEALFISYMLKVMRESIPRSGLLDEGLQGEIFKAMFDQEIAKRIARAKGLGIAEMIYRHLSRGAPSQRPVARFYDLPPQKPSFYRIQRYSGIVRSAAQRYKVDPNLIRAIIIQESGGDPQAISHKGAKGLMQLMPQTAREMGVKDVFDPEENIFAGTKYFRKLLDKFKGDLILSLAAYNAGPGAVERYGGIPPFKETRDFVKRVLEIYRNS